MVATLTRQRASAQLLLILASEFMRDGCKAYLVGGSVRDRLLGRPEKDLDLATDAVPERTREVVGRTRPDGLYDVGARFGTIGAVYELGEVTIRLEITTFRTEAYEAGSRKPAVAFGTSLQEDLSRRDFTINAMAKDLLTGEVIDPFGGQADLSAQVVRAVGKPQERFSEDPVRMLRAVRLAVELGFRIDTVTQDAIWDQAERLETISRERVAEEVNRILVSPDPAGGLRTLAEMGLMRWAVPELLPLRDTTAGRRSKDVFEHTLRVVENTRPDLVLRWSALLHDVGKSKTVVVEEGEVHYPGHEWVGEAMARQILSGLRLDGDTVDRVGRLVGMHMRANQYEPEWTDGAVRRLMREAGDELDRLLALSAADVTSYQPRKVAAARARVDALRVRCQRIAEQENIAKLQSPLDGHDLMSLFDRRPGPWIGAIKERLLDMVIDGELGMEERERAAQLARSWVDGEALSGAKAGSLGGSAPAPSEHS